MQILLKEIIPTYFEKEQIAGSEIWGKNITFSKGEHIYIVAPSGSGKTSLIHFIYGLRKDYDGTISYQNENIKDFYIGQILSVDRQSVEFANFNGLMILFIAILAVSLFFMPRLTRFVVTNLDAHVSEPEVKFIFFMLFMLGGLATTAGSEAVLPAYLVGLVIAGVFIRDKMLITRMRGIAFALLTPFYFLKAGLFVSLPAVIAGAGLIAVLLGQGTSSSNKPPACATTWRSCARCYDARYKVRGFPFLSSH